MKRTSALIILLFILAACSQPTPEPTSTPTVTPVPPTETLVPTDTPIPTDTNTPTPEPTNTPRPTSTPIPTSTPTAEPISLSGSGDSVADADTGGNPSIAHITHTGGGNFAVWNHSADGERIDLLINTIGAYDGVVPIDLLDDEFTTRFAITASGPWTIEVLPLNQAREEELPTLIEGRGDDVLILRGDDPDVMTIDASAADSNFAIWGFSDRRRLLVNEIAPYTGVVIMDREIFLLIITAEGPWSLDITSP